MPANKYLHIKKRKKHRKNNTLRYGVDRLCMFASVFMPLTAAPQIYMLYTTKDAGGLSLSMWVLYLIGVIPFLLFGILHKEVQLVLLNGLWIVATCLMIFGIVMYR